MHARMRLRFRCVGVCMARSGLREENWSDLTFCVNGKRITPAVQKNLLERMSGATQSAGECTVGEGLEEQLERWMRVFVLRQSAEEGRLSLPEVMDGFSRVHHRDVPDSRGDASPLWALNLQARYARLARKGDEARALYKELRRRCRSAALKRGDDDSFQRLPVLDVMSEIGLAWCDHQDNRSAAALMRLEQMSDRFEGDAAALRLSSRLGSRVFQPARIGAASLAFGAHHTSSLSRTRCRCCATCSWRWCVRWRPTRSR